MIDRILRQISEMPTFKEYRGESGKVYSIRVSEYYDKGKPRFYISVKNQENGKYNFLSGLFETEDKNKFSFDLKDNLGFRHYFELFFNDKKIIIENRMNRSKQNEQKIRCLQ